MSLKRIDPNPRMSEGVVHGDVVYLGGQVADDPSLPIEEQTRETLANVDAFLAAAGTDKSKILAATIWLADMALKPCMDAVWDAWVAPGSTPARACVEAKLANPQYLVEIKVTAAR